MKPARYVPLLVSLTLASFLLGGGLAVKVGAEENSFHQVVVFSEVLSLVLDNYVDPLEAQALLGSAYEGMLGGLDAHGAFLTPDELTEWKARSDGGETADPGVSVLRAGHALQIVAVEEGSPAADGGLEVGDQIRGIDGRPVRDLSLDQSWRLIRGAPGTTVALDVLHAGDGFRREEVELVRRLPRSRPYSLSVKRDIAVLRLTDVARSSPSGLAGELDDVRSRGVTTLLLDLRNVADLNPRGVATVAGMFTSGPLLRLKDREGKVLELVEGEKATHGWTGSVAALVNGATAGGAEALAALVKADLGGVVVGEPTYGLGSELKLYELGDGTGILVSAAAWETAAGATWNGDGVEPDEVIRGKGGEYEERLADQLEQTLVYLESRAVAAAAAREAA